jgi:hypothetical protein
MSTVAVTISVVGDDSRYPRALNHGRHLPHHLIDANIHIGYVQLREELSTLGAMGITATSPLYFLYDD